MTSVAQVNTVTTSTSDLEKWLFGRRYDRYNEAREWKGEYR
jgi:hypothetical protein